MANNSPVALENAPSDDERNVLQEAPLMIVTHNTLYETASKPACGGIITSFGKDKPIETLKYSKNNPADTKEDSATLKTTASAETNCVETSEVHAPSSANNSVGTNLSQTKEVHAHIMPCSSTVVSHNIHQGFTERIQLNQAAPGANAIFGLYAPSAYLTLPLPHTSQPPFGVGTQPICPTCHNCLTDHLWSTRQSAISAFNPTSDGVR